MKRKLFWFILAAFLVISIHPGIQSTVHALPSWQAHILGSSPNSPGDFEDDWVTFDGNFTLAAVAAYGPKTESMYGYLLVSVPEGEMGFVSIDGLSPVTTAPGSGAAADTNILWNGPDPDGFATTDFFPDNFNQHFPLHDDVSDFIIFDLGEFEPISEVLNDYNADAGTITAEDATGEEKLYEVSVGGFSWVHFDVFGYSLTWNKKIKDWVIKWEISPASHDSTVIPEPATMLLLGVGLIGLVGIGRKHLFRTS